MPTCGIPGEHGAQPSGAVCPAKGRLVFLSNTIAGGGAEKQMLLLAVALRAAGYTCEIHWLDGHEPKRAATRLVEQAAQTGVELRPPAGGRSFDARQVWRLWRILRADPTAMLWTWGYRADLVAIILRSGGCGNRIIGSLRSAFEERIHRYRLLWRILGRTHDAFVSNTRKNIELVGGVAPVVPGKSVVVYNAVEPLFFTGQPALGVVRPSTLRIVMLGNQSIHTKGYDLAVELAEKLAGRGVPAKVIIGGAPADTDVLRRLIGRNAAPVELAGHVDDPASFLRSGHVFLMLSRYEGTPNALLEAMALGLPAICTRVGDVAHFARDRVHLRLIDTNADSALDAVVNLWEDWPAAVRMAATGRELCARQFSGTAMLEAALSVLQEVSEQGTYRANKMGST